MAQKRRRNSNNVAAPEEPSAPQSELQRAAARLRRKADRDAKLVTLDAGLPTPEQFARNRYETTKIKDPDAPEARWVKRNLSSRNLERWYASKKIDERQFTAGERYRGDYERTGFEQRVTSRYEGGGGGGDGTYTPAMPGTVTQMDAWRAWRAAREQLDNLAQGFDAMTIHDQIAIEIDPAEDRVGIFTQRTSMMAVQICLDRLVSFYRL